MTEESPDSVKPSADEDDFKHTLYGCGGCVLPILIAVLLFNPISCRLISPPIKAHIREAIRPEIVYSSDGSSLLFTKFSYRSSELHILDVSNGKSRPLRSGKQLQFSPRVSPDGRYVIYCEASGTTRSRLCRLDLQTGEFAVIEHPRRGALWPQISPDGTSVVFCSISRSGKSRLRMHSLAEEEGEDITELRDIDAVPSFYPDGKSVVFWSPTWYGHSSPIAADRFHDWSLYKLNLESKASSRLFYRQYYSITVTAPVFMDNYIYFEPSEYEREIPARISANFADEPESIPLVERLAEPKDEFDRFLVQIQNPKLSGENGKLLVEVTSEGRMMDAAVGEICLIDVETGEVEPVTDLKKIIEDFALSPDEKSIAVLTADNEVWLWEREAKTSKQLF